MTTRAFGDINHGIRYSRTQIDPVSQVSADECDAARQQWNEAAVRSSEAIREEAAR